MQENTIKSIFNNPSNVLMLYKTSFKGYQIAVCFLYVVWEPARSLNLVSREFKKKSYVVHPTTTTTTAPTSQAED